MAEDGATPLQEIFNDEERDYLGKKYREVNPEAAQLMRSAQVQISQLNPHSDEPSDADKEAAGIFGHVMAEAATYKRLAREVGVRLGKVDDKFVVGDTVEARFQHGPKFFIGKVTAVHADGTFDIQYDDGDFEERVPRFRISWPGEKQLHKLSVGERVDAHHAGGSNTYTGKVVKVNVAAEFNRSAVYTYDVEYDDGDKESQIMRKFIHAQRRPPPRTQEELNEMLATLTKMNKNAIQWKKRMDLQDKQKEEKSPTNN